MTIYVKFKSNCVPEDLTRTAKVKNVYRIDINNKRNKIYIFTKDKPYPDNLMIEKCFNMSEITDIGIMEE